MRYYEFYTCNLNEDFEINHVVQPATIYCISFSTRIAFPFLPKAMFWFDSFQLLLTTNNLNSFDSLIPNKNSKNENPGGGPQNLDNMLSSESL